MISRISSSIPTLLNLNKLCTYVLYKLFLSTTTYQRFLHICWLYLMQCITGVVASPRQDNFISRQYKCRCLMQPSTPCPPANPLDQVLPSHFPAAADTDSGETNLLGDKMSGLVCVDAGVTWTGVNVSVKLPHACCLHPSVRTLHD